jgi:hypothetical protein
VKVAEDAPVLLGAHDGADVRDRVEGVADLERLQSPDEAPYELVVQGGRQQQPGARLACLPDVQQEGVGGAVDGRVEVGVLQNDVGALAAELQGSPA